MVTGGGQIDIETPEHVVLHYQLAGVMSRMIAAGADLILQALIALAIFLSFLVAFGGYGDAPGLSQTALAVMALLFFADVWRCSVPLETLRRGRTPGTIWVALRVIREGGYPLAFGDVMVRNLLRVVDFLPGGYGLGLIVMCSNARCKRIGDFVAGTIVIQDKPHDDKSSPRL